MRKKLDAGNFVFFNIIIKKPKTEVIIGRYNSDVFPFNNEILFKSPFVPNCIYGFLRNDFSWHSVEPVDVAPNYIRKSLNISFIYKN